MGYPIKSGYPVVTVAQNDSVSGAIDLGAGTAIGFIVPAALEATTTNISFLGASSLGGTYKVVKQGGTKLTVPVAASDYAMLAGLTDLYGVRYLKIQLETAAGVAVAQATAARVFEVVQVDAL